MYIERGLHDWNQTAALLHMIYMAAPAKKSAIEAATLNPFLRIKNNMAAKPTAQPAVPLSRLSEMFPGIRVIDRRTKTRDEREENR